MSENWRSSTWGEEISLEYGKSNRTYNTEKGRFRVYGSNGPIGWTDTALVNEPGVVLGRKGAYRGVQFSKTPFFVIDTAYYVKPKNGNDIRWLYYAIISDKLGEIDDGSPIPSTTRSAVYVRERDVPPIKEQKAIASILGSRAVEITGNDVGDAPVLPALLAQIPEDEEIASVTADGAYDTRRCHETIAERGAQAVIPPRKNGKPWSPTSPGAIARNEALRAVSRFGRTIWRWWSGYHRRSRVETKMNCIKLLGQRLMARDFDRQIAVFHVRVAILNRFTALGVPLIQPVT